MVTCSDVYCKTSQTNICTYICMGVVYVYSGIYNKPLNMGVGPVRVEVHTLK